MNQNRSNALAWWSAATILISAFLLFQVQPVITKKILPWFGGSPAVWTTCVLFFQLVLLAGYAYAHFATHLIKPRWQGVVHLVIVLLAVLLLPIVPAERWKPINGDTPALRILLLLTFVVGVPYFVLSTTGPLVQAWFARLYPGRSPYRLYSLSNVGSLAALLTYPFLIETTLRVDAQGYVWSLVFIAFAALIGILALNIWRHDKQALANGNEPVITATEGLIAKRTEVAGVTAKPAVEEASTAPVERAPAIGLRIAWLSLAALASLVFLAITNHLCQDIAVVPFMWVIPLSLYLLSFIICFDNERWYLRKTYGVLTILMVMWLTAIEQYPSVNRGLEYPQKVVRVLFWGSGQPAAGEQEETPEDAPKVTFSKQVELAQPFYSSPFTRTNDWMFDTVGMVVEKIDGVWQWIAKDRTPVVLESGETFASLDQNKDGKLTVGEFPVSPLTALVDWDIDSNNEVSEDEFNRKAGKRETARIVFDVDTYDFKEHVVVASAAYMFALFCICMVCHGELVKSKPAPKYLTSFYLSISAGGALGGLFVGLLCPMIFKTHFELAIGLIGGFIVGWLTIFNDGREKWLKGRDWLQWALLLLVMAPTAVFVMQGNVEEIEMRRLASLLPARWQETLTRRGWLAKPDDDLLAIERNFYGTVTVSKMGDEDEDPDNAGRALYNGRIWHGFQFTSPERELEPSTYYVTGTGAALAVQENPRAGQGLRVAVIGLGSGSMAAHAQSGDTYRFYDIDPKVYKVAKEQFTYLDKIPAARNAKVEVVMGDGRLSMERELKEQGPLNYDVIHLDAFSGDAIPAHLLTEESFALYEKHLRHEERVDEATGEKIKVPTGIIVVHISNRYLDLEPVVAAIAKKYGYQTWAVHKGEEGGPTDTASDWVLVTKNEEFLNNPRVKLAGEPLRPKKELLWTDQFTALWDIMK